MKIATEKLTQDLVKRTQEYLNTVQGFNELSLEQLNWKASTESWSVLECLEHLNLYGDFYLPEIEKQIQNTSKKTPSPQFKSSWLGNYFANVMLPREKLNTMKTFKDKNPNGSQLDKATIERFVNQQKKMLELLEQSKMIDLVRTKTNISISTWIKLRLGDTFRVVIYHNYRHILQAQNVLAAQKKA